MVAGQVSDTMGLAATDLVVNALSPDHHDSGMLRRDVLCGGGAAMLGSKLRTELPLYLGGEECFCTREIKDLTQQRAKEDAENGGCDRQVTSARP